MKETHKTSKLHQYIEKMSKHIDGFISWYSLQIPVGTCEYYAVTLSLVHVFARFPDYEIC